MSGLAGTLIAHGLSIGASVVIALIALSKAISTKWGDHYLGFYFNRQLEAFKRQQDEKIEKLKEQLAHLSDRGKHSNEKEYAAATLIWQAYVDAHYATWQVAAQYDEYPDFDQMSDGNITDYLHSVKFTEREVRDVLDAQAKSAKYLSIVQSRFINDARRSIGKLRRILTKQGIFIDKPLYDSVDSYTDRLNYVWGWESSNFGKALAPVIEAERNILLKSDEWIEELGSQVRERLYRSDEKIAAREGRLN